MKKDRRKLSASMTDLAKIPVMRTTFQHTVLTASCSCMLLLGSLGAQGQSTFQNLGFENTTLTVIVVNDFGPVYTTNATLPGWAWSPRGTFGFGDPNTTVSLNGLALDAPAVTLHGSTPSRPAFQGSYMVFLQGGSTAGGLVTGNTNGASVFQTGQIPVTARSLTYLGNAALHVSFKGQSLSPVPLNSTPTYTRWGIDISPHAGQSGELRFVVPWLATSMLDGIQFSSITIPEPSIMSLSILGLVLVAASTRTTNRR